MQKVIHYVTYDGVRHETERNAIKHLDNVFNDRLFQIAAPLVVSNTHSAVCKFVASNLELFEELSRIRADMTVENNNV